MRFNLSAILPYVLVATLAWPAQAQDGCLRVSSVPPGVTLTIGGAASLSLAAPGTYCSLVPGRTYTLTASTPSHETRVAKFRMSADGNVSFAGNWMGAWASSVIVPGWGQASLGSPGRSAEALLSTGSAALRTWQALEEYDSEKEAVTLWTDLFAVSTSEAERNELRDRAALSRANSEAYRDHLYLAGSLAGLWYLGNLYETFSLTAPLKTRRTEDGGVEVRLPRRSKPRAVFRSVLWPGMGQKYNGDRGKSFLFQWSFNILSFYALDRKLEYDLSDAEYTFFYNKFSRAGSVAERERFRREAALRWDDREQHRRSMYKFAIAAGGVWVVNVIDAIVFGGRADLPDRFELETGFDTKTMRTGIKVAF